MSRPIPVPSECVDLTPPVLWDTYWLLYPSGTQMIPSVVPRKVWFDHWKTHFPHDRDIPDPPVLWRNYWGRFQDENERDLKNRHSVIHPRFWAEYFRHFPRGHENTRRVAHDYQK